MALVVLISGLFRIATGTSIFAFYVKKGLVSESGVLRCSWYSAGCRSADILNILGLVVKISGGGDFVLEGVVLAEVISKGELFMLGHVQGDFVLTNFELGLDPMRDFHAVDGVHGRMGMAKLHRHARVKVALREVVDLLIGLIRQMHT